MVTTASKVLGGAVPLGVARGSEAFTLGVARDSVAVPLRVARGSVAERDALETCGNGVTLSSNAIVGSAEPKMSVLPASGNLGVSGPFLIRIMTEVESSIDPTSIAGVRASLPG